MCSKQRRGSGGGRVWCGLAAVLALGFLSTSMAHAEWKILLSRDSDKDKAAAIGLLGLRPNAEERVYVHVENTDENGEQVTVRLLQSAPGGVPQLLVEKVISVAGKTKARVSFAKAEAEAKPPAEGKPAAEKKSGGSFTALAGPPHTLEAQVVRVAANGVETLAVSEKIQVRVLTPSEQIEVKLDPKYEETTATLSVTVAASKDFSGETPCTVELNLSPSYLPGLLAGKRVGAYRGKLLKPLQEVQLVANNVRFDSKSERLGRVYLDVDRCPRAIGYDLSFTVSGVQPKQITEPSVRLPIPVLISKSTEKMPLPVEVFNAKERDDDVWIEVFLDRNKDGKPSPDEVERFRGARQQRLSVSTTDASGGLLFKSEVKDWQIELDTTGLYGAVEVRVRLTDAQGKLYGAAEAKGELLIDESVPDILDVTPREKNPIRGNLATVRVRAEDKDTGIEKVLLFVGDLTEGKAGKEAPRDAEVAELVLGQTDLWEADLLMPDRKGKVTITALVFNRAGLTKPKSISVTLADPPTAGGADAQAGKKYKVSGKVIEGELPQGDLDVVLKDEKGMVKATTKSSKDKKTVGAFTFENVAPGVYSVSSSKVGSNTKGEAPVTVEMADVTGVVIKLFR